MTVIESLRVCNEQSINISCTEDNIIHIENLLFGDFWFSYSRTCPELMDDFSGVYGKRHCEVDVQSSDLVYYGQVIDTCEGKPRCDFIAEEGIRCYYYTNNRADYVRADYYCFPGKLMKKNRFI